MPRKACFLAFVILVSSSRNRVPPLNKDIYLAPSRQNETRQGASRKDLQRSDNKHNNVNERASEYMSKTSVKRVWNYEEPWL